MVRRIPWKTIAIGGAVAGGLGAFVVATRKSAPQPPKRVALIGDSYAVGLGPELAKLLPDFKFAGVEGTNTSQWASHATKCGTCGDWIPAFKPDIVLVSLGTNDGSTPNSANYQAIVRGLHGLGARVVWIEPPAGVRNDAVRQIIASLGVLTVSATQVPLDGIHPNVTGYQVWAGEIVQTLGRNDLLPLFTAVNR